MDLQVLRDIFYSEVFCEVDAYVGRDGRQHGLYVIQNIVNGKIYVGRHSGVDVKGDRYFGSGVALRAAIRKYGRGNFRMKYFHFSDSMEELHYDEGEVLEIMVDGVFGGDWGLFRECSYNLRKNGGFNFLSDETRVKLSRVMVERYSDVLEREKVRDRNLVIMNLPEVRVKYSGMNGSSFRGLIIGEHCVTGVLVVFDGVCSMERLGFDSSSVYKCVGGSRRVCRGYEFRRVVDDGELVGYSGGRFDDEWSLLILESYLCCSFKEN